jgi:hypothetical protein
MSQLSILWQSLISCILGYNATQSDAQAAGYYTPEDYHIHYHEISTYHTAVVYNEAISCSMCLLKYIELYL